VANSRKTLFAMTFAGLMAGVFGLLLAYDRFRPAGGGRVLTPR